MKESDYLRRQAEECRATSLHAGTPRDRIALQQLAGYYEREAMKMEIRVPVSFGRF
jgi:hypothetical protein